MGLGLLLIPTLAGYWFLTHSNFTRFKVIRESGYHILLKSAIYGLLLFILANLAVIVLIRPCFPQFSNLICEYAPYENSDSMLVMCVFSPVFSIIGNWFRNKETATRKDATDNGNHIELLIAESCENQKLIELSLRNRKSYIGFAIEVPRLVRKDDDVNDIKLIPIASGYRDEETLELVITTNHAPVIQEFTEDPTGIALEDFHIIIRMVEIVSVRIFDIDVYERFRDEA